MLPILFLVSGWLTPTQQIELSGDAAFYNPGKMEIAARNQGISLDGYIDGVALMSCGDLDRTIWLGVNGLWTGPYKVCDCSQRNHYQMNLDRGRVVDLSWDTWDNLGLPLMPYPALVRFRPPMPEAFKPE